MVVCGKVELRGRCRVRWPTITPIANLQHQEKLVVDERSHSHGIEVLPERYDVLRCGSGGVKGVGGARHETHDSRMVLTSVKGKWNTETPQPLRDNAYRSYRTKRIRIMDPITPIAVIYSSVGHGGGRACVPGMLWDHS
jgi:hypothetical protein